MLPTPKLFKIDYDFIISNYLSPELWKKKWNLFIYRDNIFTLELQSIQCYNRSIYFKIAHNKQQYSSECVECYLDNTPLPVLLKQINGAIWRLIERYEERQIKSTDEYYRLSELVREEDQKLRDIAASYLDECGVHNDDIREAYIDRYASNNSKMDITLSSYVSAHKYKVLTDFMLVFTEITKDKARTQTILTRSGDYDAVNRVKEEVAAFEEEFCDEDGYEETMREILEGI